MSNPPPEKLEATAVDDVRHVRERIAREHAGDLQKHVQETNRIAAELQVRLKIKVVSAPPPDKKRAGEAI